MAERTSPFDFDGSGRIAEHYIQSEQSLVERPPRTLKHDDLFAVFDVTGDLRPGTRSPDGVYFEDTRFLSRFELTLGGEWPLLLDSVVLEDNSALIVDLTNTDLHDPEGHLQLARGTVFVNRSKFLKGNDCYERLSVRNFGSERSELALDVVFAADFADLFEVRGDQRVKRGTNGKPEVRTDCVELGYTGLDGLRYICSLTFDPPPARLLPSSASWNLGIDPGQRTAITITVRCTRSNSPELPRQSSFPLAYRGLRSSMKGHSCNLQRVTSSNALFNEVLRRAASDIDMLLTQTEQGSYPYAGVPWYSTVFGRDGIITALQLLPYAPEVALGVLLNLASSQATEFIASSDAEPGKIIHEMRAGEMARLGEVPFHRYYGSVDATPLFVMLAGAYLDQTGDLPTLQNLWPNIQAALTWMDQYGDRDGDGFVEYHRATTTGLEQQGWKDSYDSIFHEDGSSAKGPIALCEVQAYVFAAKRSASSIARALGQDDVADLLEKQAERLRLAFEEQFWVEELRTYALALDGNKNPCRVRTSNAGHALFAGIASPQRASHLAQQLMSRAFFSGWGIRTLASDQPRFNPMSYHNGSVWPHDNSLIALGLSRYGHAQATSRILEGLFAAATFDEIRRLPELLCGFKRRPQRGPTGYPVACSPQAWAAGSLLALLTASVGLEIDHAGDAIRLNSPYIPPFLSQLSIPDLRVGSSRISLHLEGQQADVGVRVTDRSGSAKVIVIK